MSIEFSVWTSSLARSSVMPVDRRRHPHPSAAPRGNMIAAEGLATVGGMIVRYRGGGRFTSDDEIARITVALRDLRVRDDA